MEIIDKIQKIQKDEIVSRYNSYIIFCPNNKEIINIEEKNNVEYEYIDFEIVVEDFFKKSNMNLKIFDNGNFFKYLHKIFEGINQSIIIDNLEIIENILYNKEGDYLKKFFSELAVQIYKEKVFFIIRDIKKMKIEKEIKKSNFPNKNILYIEKNIDWSK